MKKAVIIIAEKDFQDKEYSGTKKSLEKAGIEAITCSKSKGVKKGVLGGEVNAEIGFDEVREEEFDCVAFIGGGGAQRYINDKEAWKIAKTFHNDGKIVAAICIAPLILASCGILKGKRVTVWDDGNRTQIGMIEKMGVEFEDKNVVRDGNIITANGPHAAEQFGKEIAEALK